MQNDQEKRFDDTQPAADVMPSGQASAVGSGKGSAGDTVCKSDCPQRTTRAKHVRKDKGRLHARHYGVLSRDPLAALIRLGANPRQLLKIKKKLRADLKPTGILGDILLDRAWSSYLRCLLIARVEAHLFVPVDEGNSDRMPELKAMELPTLIFPEPGARNYKFSDDLMKHLETALRYDAHYAREFYRAVGLLIAMQRGGLAGVLDCL